MEQAPLWGAERSEPNTPIHQVLEESECLLPEGFVGFSDVCSYWLFMEFVCPLQRTLLTKCIFLPSADGNYSFVLKTLVLNVLMVRAIFA